MKRYMGIAIVSALLLCALTLPVGGESAALAQAGNRAAGAAFDGWATPPGSENWSDEDFNRYEETGLYPDGSAGEDMSDDPVIDGENIDDEELVAKTGEYKGYRYNVYKSGLAAITGYASPAGSKDAASLKVPGKLDGHMVYIIGPHAFSGCSADKITLPEGIMQIEAHAFDGASVKSVVLPESLQYIGDYAFSGCTGLTDFRIPAGTTGFGAGVFRDCRNIRITVDSGNQSIRFEDGALIRHREKKLILFVEADCNGPVTVPGGIRAIGENAFAGCNRVTRVNLPASLERIESGAFSDCKKLSRIEVPEGVISIGNNAFAKCESLDDVVLPESLTALGNGAFFDCRSLRELSIPGGVKTLYNIVEDCNKLETLHLNEGLETIAAVSLVDFCFDMESLFIPDSVKRLPLGFLSFCKAGPITLQCHSGTYAERFAVDQGIPYKIVS